MDNVMTAVSSKSDLQNIILFAKDLMGSIATNNLRNYVEKDEVELILPKCNIEQDLWDGTLLIKFKRYFSAQEVVNKIIFYICADEVSFEDENTLRIWWD